MNIFFSLIYTLLSSYPSVIPIGATDIEHDIILIQGEPRLVTLNSSGEVIASISTVNDYFDSDYSHEELVERAMKTTSSLASTRFISFETVLPELTENAVDHIRYITVVADQDKTKDILITTSQGALGRSVAESVISMIDGFGINRERVIIKEKNYLGNEDYQFLKIEIQPKKTS